MLTYIISLADHDLFENKTRHHLALWIDESLITLCQRVRFQRKGVNALSFSSR